MRNYVITGASSGIGLATKNILEQQGHTVFNIDMKNGDFTADLINISDRENAIKAVEEKFPEGLDGLILNAGIGPGSAASDIFALNFFAPVMLAEGLRGLLIKRKGNCVVTTSNTISQDTVRLDWADMLTNVMDEQRALEYADTIPYDLGASIYSTSKHALARWVRRISSSWGVDNLRINAVAPGNTRTPMTQNMTDTQMDMALLLPIPTRYGTRTFLEAEEIANTIVFLTSPLASGINGTVIYVDGGIDALLRSEKF